MAQAHDPSQPPPDSWDEEFARSLVGRVLLVGMTYLTPDEQVVRQDQFFGCVASIDSRKGITIDLEGSRTGSQQVLPPQTSNIQRAKPGEYRLRSTGEVVENPDFLASWTVREKANGCR